MNRSPIKILVEEPMAGCFHWLLVKPESNGGCPEAVERARAPMPSRWMAMMAGIAALQRRVDAHRDHLQQESPGDTLH